MAEQRGLTFFRRSRPRHRRGHRLGALVAGDQRFLPGPALELPDAEPDHRQDRHGDDQCRQQGDALHGSRRPASPARRRYSAASSLAFEYRSPTITASVVSGSHSTAWTQNGGSAASWSQIARPVTTAPTIIVKNAAG